MAVINIDLKKVKNANYNLPPAISNLSAQKRYINMLKWRIFPEIQDRRNIRERLEDVLREIDKLERQLGEIYHVTETAVSQYTDMEIRLTEDFIKSQ